MTSVHVLYDGYSYRQGENLVANCTCTLIRGEKTVLVDTMTAWDADKLIRGLATYGLDPSKIDYVVGTHGHSDHVGNLNLFLNAVHIVGFSVSHKDRFFDHPFDKGEPYVISEDIKVVPSPGHTADDISVYVTTQNDQSPGSKVIYAVAGDLFESEEDIEEPAHWLEHSWNPETQKRSRFRVSSEVDVIIPGHGAQFALTPTLRRTLRAQMGNSAAN